MRLKRIDIKKKTAAPVKKRRDRGWNMEAVRDTYSSSPGTIPYTRREREQDCWRFARRSGEGLADGVYSQLLHSALLYLGLNTYVVSLLPPSLPSFLPSFLLPLPPFP